MTLSKKDQAVLKERARALAHVVYERPPAPGKEYEIAVFVLGRERYGLDTACIEEASLLENLTPLPQTPPVVAGVINYRGRILPVIDTKKLLGLEQNGMTDYNKLLIVASAGQEVAFLADNTAGVAVIRPSELRPPLPGNLSDCAVGVTQDGVTVLDAARLLSMKEGH